MLIWDALCHLSAIGSETMPSMKTRVLLTLSATILSAACGMLAGNQLARAIGIRVTESRLDQYATSIVSDWEASSSELRTVLNAMAVSNHRACGGKEIAYFRGLIFESDYLKDAGRMRDGTIQCSAALGPFAPAAAQSTPDFVQQDGASIYRSLPQYRDQKGKALSSDQTVLTLQLGDFFVAFTPYSRMHLQAAPMHYTETAIDSPTQKAGQLLGDSPQLSLAILANEGMVRLGDSLYGTHCSIRYFNCVTAYASIPEVLQSNRTKFISCIALCGLGGGLAGLLLSLLYRRNKSIEQQLRRAIRRDKLRLVYQPLVDLKTKRIVGAESLVRWTPEDGTPVGPDVFVRIAEERGFVGEITQLVLRHAIREFGETLRNQPSFRLSINVAAADLVDPAFLPMLDQVLKKAAVPATSLAIEITEGSTARREGAIETIRSLRQRGHSVHIDDFGTGYSSLAYLHELSVDAIKIDRSFTQAIGTDAVMVGILPQILSMAEALNLAVIAEGIETSIQAEYFATADRGVVAQGWLFGRPAPADAFLKLLVEDAKKSLALTDPHSRAVALSTSAA